jgi:hypothetical protein
MVRISWPLALAAAAAIALVARRPGLFVPVLIVGLVWYAWMELRRRR